MDQYLIYILYGPEEDWQWFDPVSDLLLRDDYFATWRGADKIAPPGSPLAVVSYSGRNWCIGSLRKDEFGLFPLVGKWLTPQMVNPRSLGQWEASLMRGMFTRSVLVGNPHSWLEGRFQRYNQLLGFVGPDQPKPVVRPDPMAENTTDPQFDMFGRVLGCTIPSKFSVVQCWDQIRPKLLDDLRLTQHQRLGLPANVKVN